MATQPISPIRAPDPEQIVEQWKGAVSRGEMTLFGSLYAADAQLLVPLSAEPLRGREAIQQYETAVSSAFPGATLKITRPISRGDIVAVEWEYSGTNSGPLAAPDGLLPPTNRAVTLRGASFLRFNSDGLIVEEHRYYDRSSLLQQLGLQ